jgi:hypothetical protein
LFISERDQAEAIFKGVMTNYKIFEDGAHQILQTDKDLQKRLQSQLSEPAAPSTETHPEAKSAETSLTGRISKS